MSSSYSSSLSSVSVETTDTIPDLIKTQFNDGFKVSGHLFIHSGHINFPDFINSLFTLSAHINSQQAEHDNTKAQKPDEAAY